MADFAAAVETQVIYCDLLALGDVSQSVDGMSFDQLVPVFLCVVIAGVVDAAGFKEDPTSNSVGLNGEAVRSNDTERLLNDILVWIEVV